jgi:hypothetical protein
MPKAPGSMWPAGVRFPPWSHWPPRDPARLAAKPRSCICIYELMAGEYVLKYQLTGCPWHTKGTR